MKTDAVTFADLGASVLAVPPLARNADLSFNPTANAALIKHIEAGGVSTLLYGGNANFYNIGLYEYASILDSLAELAAPGTWVIPSVGPDFGKMLDQAAILKSRKFPTAMALPMTFPMTPAGSVVGLRKFAEAYGKPIIVYIKAEGSITPEGVKSLVDSGVVAAIKYAIVRADPSKDPLLSKLCDLVDKRYIVSGIGERPVMIHLRDFGLNGFTSGSVCVAPRGSAQILIALKKGDHDTAARIRERYLPLEDARDAYSPIRVLHEAVRLAGIADMGPVLPLLTNIEPERHDEIKTVASALLAADRG